MKLQQVLAPGLAALPVPELLGGNVNYLFTFGDSYTTTGFNVSAGQPAVGNPMGNPELGQGTASDGINWVGYLTTLFNHTLTFSYNLAVYGATIDNEVVSNVPGDVVSQIRGMFGKHYCRGAADTTPETTSLSATADAWTEIADAALFVIWVGINDVQFSYLALHPLLQLTAALDTYFQLLTELYDCGARRFLVMNVPPTTRTPNMLTHGPIRRARHLTTVHIFNLLLERMVKRWARGFPDATVMLFDVFAFMAAVLDDPQRYGFRDGTCVGEEGCVWWDDFHPRSEFHFVLARQLEGLLGGGLD
ncbi:SGNH/GDSL hydrolase family protein [Aspergillus aculeatinus CBS 121060]|uniref:Uncharacterized protein n=1 Tax=Aspergillus aculeatinus CBS 121060 TaxID=1448322 RepID=A0ACD1GV98_9EURO|nr:hypothetical protein BO66DRAFT_443247 [Aspergillus aculeatinus CBS 121060]RAH65254.1 hypothetical protein BO66DRAFT_443247 [Aspergillus aculeatinus CBS 121060]